MGQVIMETDGSGDLASVTYRQIPEILFEQGITTAQNDYLHNHIGDDALNNLPQQMDAFLSGKTADEADQGNTGILFQMRLLL